MPAIQLKDINKMKAVIKAAPKLSAIRYNAAMKIAVNLIRVEMRRQAPRQSGNLQRSIKGSVSKLTGRVGPDLGTAPYAKYVHGGTGIYGQGGKRIRPRTKQALFWKGALHPVKSVRGQRANPFVDRTANAAQRFVPDVFQKATDNLVEEIAKKSTA